MNYIEDISILIFLIICSISDIKSKKIYVKWWIVFSVAGVVESILLDTNWVIKILFGILPGLLLYIFSIVSKGEIGKGDSFVVMCIGVTIGIRKSLEIFILGLFFTVIISLPYLFYKRKNWRLRVPFIPFLLMAFLTISLI